MINILLVDNYDSFTYNLVHYFEATGECRVDVLRNDEIDLKAIDKYDGLVLSPGPGLPSQSGQLLELIQKGCTQMPILGVCLGMQGLSEVFGGSLKNLESVYHGVETPVFLSKESQLFYNLPSEIVVGRYHSWVIDACNLPKEFIITAKDKKGNPMAMEHKELPLFGVQFHPESIMTNEGMGIIKNWVALVYSRLELEVKLDPLRKR